MEEYVSTHKDMHYRAVCDESRYGGLILCISKRKPHKDDAKVVYMKRCKDMTEAQEAMKTYLPDAVWEERKA